MSLKIKYKYKQFFDLFLALYQQYGSEFEERKGEGVLRRPLKTKQIFVYGAPSTQKTLLQILQKVLNIYFVSSHRNDFTGAKDYFDLWVFDEFHEPSKSSRILFKNYFK